MKIAYLINHTGQTGVNHVVLDLVTVMMAHGHECCVFYQKELEEGVKSVAYPCKTALLKSWDDLNGFDVIHTHGMGPEVLAFKARVKGTRSKALLVTTLHCYCFQDFFDLYGKVKGALMGVVYLMTKRSFDRVVCLSKDMMQYYDRWIPKKKLTYIYNTRNLNAEELYVSDAEKQELRNFKGDGTLIGMNCVLLYRKGIDVMLKALQLLPDSYRLFIAGDGKEQDTFVSMAEEYGVTDRVCFAGRRKDASRYLPYYDIYAMPSRSEGFPLVLLEAAACGIKVVASSLPVVKESFTDEEVITFDMPDAQALADAIVRATEDQQLGANLKQRYELDYAPEIFYQRYMEVYGDSE